MAQEDSIINDDDDDDDLQVRVLFFKDVMLCVPNVMTLFLKFLPVQEILSLSHTCKQFHSQVCILKSKLHVPNRKTQEEGQVSSSNQGHEEGQEEEEARTAAGDFLLISLPIVVPDKTLYFRAFFTIHIPGAGGGGQFNDYDLGTTNAIMKNGKGIIVASSREFPIVSARQYTSIEFIPRPEQDEGQTYFLSCKVSRQATSTSTTGGRRYLNDWSTLLLEDIETESLIYGQSCNVLDSILKTIHNNMHDEDVIDWNKIADSLSCKDLPLHFKRRLLQDQRDDEGNNLLHLACIQNAPVSSCRVLYSIGGHESVLLRNHLGHTPLHSLCIKCHTQEHVEALIEVGGMDIIEAEDENKCTALQLACWKGQEQAIIPILQLGGKDLIMKKHPITGWSTLHFASACDEEVLAAKVINLLVTSGGKQLVMARDNDGETVMHKASSQGNIAIMKVLLQTVGTEIATLKSNGGGKSPLDYAVEAENEEAILLLSTTNR